MRLASAGPTPWMCVQTADGQVLLVPRNDNGFAKRSRQMGLPAVEQARCVDREHDRVEHAYADLLAYLA